MNRAVGIGLGCTVVGVSASVGCVSGAYPGTAFPIPIAMVGNTLLAVGDRGGNDA